MELLSFLEDTWWSFTEEPDWRILSVGLDTEKWRNLTGQEPPEEFLKQIAQVNRRPTDPKGDEEPQKETKEVEVGETFTVTSYSNPSTGYQWSENAQISDQSVLEQVSHKFVSTQSEPLPPPGTPGGQEVWTFKALNEGTTEVSMEYSRPWEGGEEGVGTFEIIVVVK